VSSNQVANAPKRRSSRISKAIMLAVQSVDTSRAPYREEVTTGSINCHGCTYKMRHEPRPGDIVVLDTGSGSTGHSGFPSRARVKSIQRLKHRQRSNVQRRRGTRNRRQYLGDFVAASRLVSPAIGQSSRVRESWTRIAAHSADRTATGSGPDRSCYTGSRLEEK